MLTAGGALLAWGELRVRLSRAEKDIDEKAPREVVQQGFENVDKQLTRLDSKLDKLLEGK